jgi:hypothetical protein
MRALDLSTFKERAVPTSCDTNSGAQLTMGFSTKAQDILQRAQDGIKHLDEALYSIIVKTEDLSLVAVQWPPVTMDEVRDFYSLHRHGTPSKGPSLS